MPNRSPGEPLLEFGVVVVATWLVGLEALEGWRCWRYGKLIVTKHPYEHTQREALAMYLFGDDDHDRSR